MKELCVSYEQMVNDYPELTDLFMKELNENREDVKINDIEFFYYWTLENIDDPMEEYKHMLKYDERLSYELDKVHIEIYLRYDTYIRGEITSFIDRPKVIVDEVCKLLVTIMRYEQSIYDNKEVMESIPMDIEPNGEIESILYNNNKYIENYIEEPEEFETLDEILDKINKFGYDKLTENEIKILERLSKE